jgi:arylsulfatase A-like enzyme
MIADDLVTYYPWTDSLTLDFALEGMRHAGLGRRPGRPDLLVVSLSTTDAVGHQWGPDSRESQDHLLRLDRWLGRFLDSLGTMVPEARTLVVLASDHGVQSAPAFQREVLGRPARNVWLGGLERTTRTALARWRGDFGVDFDDGLLMANTAALRARGVDVDSLAEALAASIRAEPGVRRVYTPRRLAAAPASDADAGRWRRAIPPDLGWLLAAVPAEHTLWSREAEANHGTMNVDDMRVPIVFRGPGIAAGTVRRPVRTVDIAPTLAALLGVRPTEPLDGRPLPEIVR